MEKLKIIVEIIRYIQDDGKRALFDQCGERKHRMYETLG